MAFERRMIISACVYALLSIIAAPLVCAAEDPAVKAAVLHLQRQWENIKFNVPEGAKQTAQMNALGEEADSVSARYPDQVEVLIWSGVIASERASMAGPISALTLATRARDTLEKAYKLNPAALEAGATVSLAVLYYRVPGFPIAFGDKAKARKLLEQAISIAPKVSMRCTSTAIFCMEKAMTRRRRRCSAAHWLCPRIRSAQIGIAIGDSLSRSFSPR